MESGDSVYKSILGRGDVVRGAVLYKPPLLPFEVQLLDVLGCSEEEYRYFVSEVKRLGAVRPSGYEHIPDVQAMPQAMIAAGLAEMTAAGAMVLTAKGTFIVSVGLAVASTAIAYALAPKPAQPKASHQRKLGALNEAGRYVPTTGFQSAADLATYGEPIPIVFGRYRSSTSTPAHGGGILYAPKLVWSQMFSLGTAQAAKLMYIIGEQGHRDSKGIIEPDLAGIFIGDSPLDAQFKNTYAFYWKRNTEKSEFARIRTSNRFYGDQGHLLVGNPTDTTDVFTCYTRKGASEGSTAGTRNDTGFCSAHTPSNNVEFGAYSPIRNGTPFRVNWKHIPIPQSYKTGTDDNDEPFPKGEERFKIAGSKGTHGGINSPKRQAHKVRANASKSEDEGMPGIGRNYSCRMGIIWYQRVNTTTKLFSIHGTDSEKRLTRRVYDDVKPGDKCKFQIRKKKERCADDMYAGGLIRVDDINSTVDRMREQADDAMQLGEIFAIGQTYWKVISRSVGVWGADEDKNQDIILECLENSPHSNENHIGVVEESMIAPSYDRLFVTKNGVWLEGTTPSKRIDVLDNTDSTKRTYHHTSLEWGPRDGEGFIGDSPSMGAYPGTSWYPLMRVAKGIVRNTRPCDATEIGIRSVVHQSLSGLCNFQTLLTPAENKEHERAHKSRDQNGDIIQSGTMSAMIKRASCFQIRYRQAGVSDTTSAGQWKDMRLKFAVVSSDTRPKYNWIRIIHPSDPDMTKTYEFKLVPLTVAHMRRINNSHQFILLNATNTETLTTPAKFDHGSVPFTVECSGSTIRKAGLMRNVEFISKPQETTHEGGSSTAFQMTVQREASLPNVDTKRSRVKNLDFVQIWWKRKIGGTEYKREKGHTGTTAAYSWEIFGKTVPTATDPAWKYAEVSIASHSNKPNDKVIVIGEKIKFPNLPHWSKSGSHDPQYTYAVRAFWPVGKDRAWSGWTEGTWLRISTTVSSNNPYKSGNAGNGSNAANSELSQVGHILRISGINTNFPATAGVNHAYLHEVLGAPTSLNEEKSATVSVTAGGKNLQLNITGKAYARCIKKDSGQRTYHWSGNAFGWQYKTITVNESGTTRNNADSWSVGDTREFKKSVSGSNPWRMNGFADVGFKVRVTQYQYSPEEETYTTYTGSRIFEGSSQVSDLTLYEGFVTKSNDSQPEHTIVYINETLYNNKADSGKPDYHRMTTAGTILESRRNFTTLDQLHVWLKGGIGVKRIHPSSGSPSRGTAYGNTETYGPSSLLTDLLYHLVTDPLCGIASSMGGASSQTDEDDIEEAAENFVDKSKLEETSRFLVANHLHYDGALTVPNNFRQFIADTAPFFLCDFTLIGGKFAIVPSVPVKANGTMDDTAITPKQYFTSGNILKDTFQVDYLSAEQRRDFTAVVRYRKETKNQLPIEEVEEVRFSAGSPDAKHMESFDLTNICTTRHHARLVAKYFLTVRKLVTHTISFKTTPYGLKIEPGDIIKVTTESNPYQAATTGTVSSTGVVTGPSSAIIDGWKNKSKNVYYWDSDSESDVAEGSMALNGEGKVTVTEFKNIIFSLIESNTSTDMYKVQQITLENDMTVSVVAGHFPCGDDNKSEIVKSVIDNERYTFTE